MLINAISMRALTWMQRSQTPASHNKVLPNCGQLDKSIAATLHTSEQAEEQSRRVLALQQELAAYDGIDAAGWICSGLSGLVVGFLMYGTWGSCAKVHPPT